MELNSEVKQHRKPEYPIHSLILNRWSPRAMTGEGLMDDELMPLFEAAKWAPSSYNNQSWRFVYAKRDTPVWSVFLDLLVPPNQIWCKNSAVLVVVLSKKTFDRDGQASLTHSFDTGAAVENLALQGTAQGLVVHAMQGFDYVKAQMALEVPDGYAVEAMLAIGKRASKESLPIESQPYEMPNQRKPLKEIVMEGKFRG
ncbi:MAG: nitroreductase family protein [Nanoarchaeota archaeon]